MGATRTYTVTAPAWTDGEEDCGNRLAIELDVNCNAAHGNCRFTMGLGTTANEVIEDITENTAGCVVAHKPRLTLLGVGHGAA